jgi:hypothetical protein
LQLNGGGDFHLTALGRERQVALGQPMRHLLPMFLTATGCDGEGERE